MIESSPNNLESQTQFLSKLIQTGPLYASSDGQQECARQLAEKLEEFEWDTVVVQDYTAGQLVDDPNYVPVQSFGGQYADDRDRPKQNVIGVLRGAKPGKTLLLNGHYDVEPIIHPERWERPWSSGSIIDGKIWGRGASDMLGGLSSQLYVASRLAKTRSEWSGQIIFNAVADEEVGGNGTLASLRTLRDDGFLDEPESTSCLIAEPSSATIALESLGFLHMILRAQGVARHMAGAALRENVLYDMIDVITDFSGVLHAAADRANVDRDKFWHAFGLIQGGIDAATPMPEITAESTVFYPADITVQQVRELIAEQLKTNHPAIESSFSDFYFDGHMSKKQELAELLSKTAPLDSIQTGIFPSPCDARLFEAFGISEVIVYGPGSLAQAHAANEFIKIDDIATYNAHLETALRTHLSD